MVERYDAFPRVTLFGRLLLSFIFIASGANKILSWEQSAQSMTGQGLPLVPLLLAAATVIEIGAGLAILFGLKARAAAAILFAFLIPTTLLFHGFWNLDGIERQMQLAHFMKNLAIMGGLLTVVSFGAGHRSIDARRNRRRREELMAESGTRSIRAA